LKLEVDLVGLTVNLLSLILMRTLFHLGCDAGSFEGAIPGGKLQQSVYLTSKFQLKRGNYEMEGSFFF
jgi:hypothetical protein